MKLNLGAGETVLEGFVPIDRKLGTEAYPLAYADSSVEEIRASHILEHFSFGDGLKALQDWVRVLQPGGRIRIAVPDAAKILQLQATGDNHWPFYLMGGQMHGDDFHKACYDENKLRSYMAHAGLVEIKAWESPNTDTASHPISLRLEGVKPLTAATKPADDLVKICAILTIPRLGWNDSWGCITEALKHHRIPIRSNQGVFYGQGMQRLFEGAIADGLDWVVTLDYDSMFSAEHLDRLLGWFGQRGDIDALAALQCRRACPFPLMTQAGKTESAIDGNPLLVTTAHFGMTLIRLEALKDVPKPWFFAQPDAKGEWGDERLDDDIWFWHQWRQAGKTIYVAPDVRIGHLELMVAEFDEQMQPRHRYVGEWRNANCETKVQSS